MRVFRLLTAIAFVLTSTVFIWFYANEKKNMDESHPVITLYSDEMEVSVDTPESELLKGVSAVDKKDGNLTDKVIIESVSSFIKPGVSVVTYAVCDSDNHVSSAKRIVKYKNYTPPRFVMERPLIFSGTDKIIITDVLHVTDMFDGDISDEMIIKSEDFEKGNEGTYKISVQVSNSKGDTIFADLPVVVEQQTAGAPQINLKSYLIYVKKGTDVDFNKYVKSVTEQSGEKIDPKVVIKTDYKKNVPGSYSVNYYATNKAGASGHTILTVIVEG